MIMMMIMIMIITKIMTIIMIIIMIIIILATRLDKEITDYDSESFIKMIMMKIMMIV